MKQVKVVFIHRTDKPMENEEMQVEYAKPRVLELIRSGYGVSASIFDESEGVLYITLAPEEVLA